MQAKEQAAHAIKTMPVVAIVSPSPTKGDTNPPNPNPTAPNKAEAVPACSRSHSIAKAVVEVKEKPIMKSRAISNPSYIQKLQFRFMAIHTIAERISIPMLLANVLFSGWRNLTDKPAANPIATALAAKQMLNPKAENP